MSINFDLWKLLAGLGIFLFGMQLIEESVKSLSGRAFRRIIRMYTNGRLRSIGSGALVTALLQSSSAVSLMVLAFVGAGVMNMQNAIGVIMGSNIGTTLTAWIIATIGFKIKIEALALPFIGLGAGGLILFKPASRPFWVTRLIIGFGFLFLGLDFMKTSVESFTQTFSLGQFPDYGLWFYLLVGTLVTALMQASAATIAIVLTALNSGLITFDIGAVMVIGANIGTTITVLLGAIGGVQAKKRVSLSHLVFNVITGAAAFLGLPLLVWIISFVVDIRSDSLMGLALFHTLFNMLGVVLFFPFLGPLSRLLTRVFPDYKTILTVYLDQTPPEITDAATAALRKETGHLLQECQLYNLRLLRIDERLVFDVDLPFEANRKKRYTLDEFYENIKLLHAEIFTFYSKIQTHKLDETEVKELERLIYASRNMMNSIKNFKGFRHNMDEFDGSDNAYLNAQYKLFRKRLVELYHNMGRIMNTQDQEGQYRNLLTAFVQIEEADNRFIKNTLNAVAEKKIQEMEIASLLLVNRLFTQSCRMQIYSMKDLLLSQEQVNNFDRAMDIKEIMDAEKRELRTESMPDDENLLPVVQKFFEYDLDTAAHILESMTEEEAADVLKTLPMNLSVRVVKVLQISYAATLLKDADDGFLREMTSHLDPQSATSILMRLPQEARERMTRHLSEKIKGQIRELLEYPEGSIGRTMTTDIIALKMESRAHEAIEKIRSLAKKRFPSSYVYVVDDDNRLVGVLNMRDLMLADPDKTLDEISRKDLFALHCFMDRHEAASELAKRKFFAAPVVDSENHILGIIKAERMIHGAKEDATKDIQRMFGAGGDERVFSTILFSLKKRLPWLHINLATAFLAAAVVALFEGIIAKLTILAVFLPVVAGQGGNAGAQSLAVVMRGIVMREIPKDKIFHLVLKEGKIGAINGIVIGAVTALVAWMWVGNPYLGLVIGLGMLVNLIFAGLAGASIPLIMKKIGIDPAQSSSIILTTVTDVLGFLAFLGFAVMFQNALIA